MNRFSLFFFLLTLSGSRAAEPCCGSDVLQRAAGTPEFAAAHVLKVASQPYEAKGRMIKLSDFGSEDVAYLALPTRPPEGGVILIHEWWGLNDFVKQKADELAAQGLEVVAVDVYNGRVAQDAAEAGELMKGLHLPSALKAIQSSVRLLKESPKFKVEKVATWGWCMGGGLSLQAALQVKGLDAAVIYYGPVELDRDRLAKLTVPLCGHFAMRDDWVTPLSVQQLDGLLTELDKPHEFHYYDAVHAFANPSNAKYDKAKAAEAWSVSLAFLRRTFAEPPRKPNVIDRIEKIFQ